MARRGLSVDEAARRLEETGPNEVVQRGRISVWSSIGVQLRDPLIIVLLAAFVLTVLTGDYSDAAVIALVVARTPRSVWPRRSGLTGRSRRWRS